MATALKIALALVASCMLLACSADDIDVVSSRTPFLIYFSSDSDCNQMKDAIDLLTVRGCVEDDKTSTSFEAACVRLEDDSIVAAQLVYNTTTCEGDAMLVQNPELLPATCAQGGGDVKAACLTASDLEDVLGSDKVVTFQEFSNDNCTGREDFFYLYAVEKCNAGFDRYYMDVCDDDEITFNEYSDAACTNLTFTESIPLDVCYDDDFFGTPLIASCLSTKKAFKQAGEDPTGSASATAASVASIVVAAVFSAAMMN